MVGVLESKADRLTKLLPVSPCQPGMIALVPLQDSRPRNLPLTSGRGPLPAETRRSIKRPALELGQRRQLRQHAAGTFTTSAVRGKRSFLEENAVAPATALDYRRRVEELAKWFDLRGLPHASAAQQDAGITDFLNMKWFEGFEIAEGRKYLSAWRDSHSSLGLNVLQTFPRASRALQGWARLDPGKTRAPLPWPVAALLAASMARKGMVDAALAVVLMFFGYLRPSEALRIQACDLVEPGRMSEFYAVNLHPSVRSETSKVHLSDETLLLDSVDVPWLGSLLAARGKLRPTGPLLDLDLDAFRKAWRQAVEDERLSPLNPVPYQLRHGGPSHDLLHKRRPALETKHRGRWRSEQAMRRYEAHARVEQEFQRLSPDIRSKAMQAQDQLFRLLYVECSRPATGTSASRGRRSSKCSQALRASRKHVRKPALKQKPGTR